VVFCKKKKSWVTKKNLLTRAGLLKKKVVLHQKPNFEKSKLVVVFCKKKKSVSLEIKGFFSSFFKKKNPLITYYPMRAFIEYFLNR
jgi:hypothetical protein